MILNVQAENLSFLFDQPAPVIQEFGKIIIEYFHKGLNPKLYTNLAQKFGVSKETAQKGTEELTYIFLESYKKKLNQSDFREFIHKTGFNNEQADVLSSVYADHETTLLEILQKQLKSGLPHFTDLDWRLESQIASRSLMHQNEPFVTVNLKIEEQTTPRNYLLQMEPAVLLSVTNKLKEALKESNSVVAKRVMKKFS